MTFQITIIGLGQIGASIGLALQKHRDKFTRVGHDKNPDISGKAKKLGAVDKVNINLPSSVRKADVVMLAIPADQVEETVKIIASDLKDGAVVLGTSPVTEGFFTLMKETLPAERHFVSFTPLINPLFLHDVEGGVDMADARMFERGLIAICAGRGTDGAALKLASDLAELIDAKPLFADPAEVDSYMTATHLLPQLLAAALAGSSTSQPGWSEGRKFAGRPFALVSSALAYCDKPGGIATAAAMNQPHTLRVLDQAIAQLQEMRSEIAAQDNQALNDRIQHAYDGWARWWKERGRANWDDQEMGKFDPEAAKFNFLGGSLSRAIRNPGRDDD